MSTGVLIGCPTPIESRVARVVGRPQRLLPCLGKVGLSPDFARRAEAAANFEELQEEAALKRQEKGKRE